MMQVHQMSQLSKFHHTEVQHKLLRPFGNASLEAPFAWQNTNRRLARVLCANQAGNTSTLQLVGLCSCLSRERHTSLRTMTTCEDLQTKGQDLWDHLRLMPQISENRGTGACRATVPSETAFVNCNQEALRSFAALCCWDRLPGKAMHLLQPLAAASSR